MPENIGAWWARRQRSKGVAVPYPIGAYRSEWERYPVLARQYHPDLNRNITLTQIPPAAEVYLTWQCDTGHVFVATPEEQRNRPGRVRRRSSWCPECLALAAPKRVVERSDPPVRPNPSATRKPVSTRAAARAPASGAAVRGPAPGDAFHSGRAPRPASAAEGDLRHRLGARLALDLGAVNAVKVRRPFFTHSEVWPDIVMPEFRVAIEYDTIGKFGLEHVGTREAADRRKDRLLREVGWEVIRVRCGKLQPLGDHDLVAGGVTAALVESIIETLRVLCGDLFVNAYLK